MATQHQVAKHLGISQQAVSKLVGAGVFTQSARGSLDIERCRIAYLTRLREEAAGRQAQQAAELGDDEGPLDLVAERARLAKEQADKLVMENARTRGQLVEIEDVAGVLGRQVARVRTRMLAIPAECAPRLAVLKTPPEVQDFLLREVTKALEELVGYQSEALATEGQPEVCAAPEPDAMPSKPKPTNARRAKGRTHEQRNA